MRIFLIILTIILSLGGRAAVADEFASADCVDGMAGEYPCSRVDLMAFMPADSVGGGTFNDVWGWTDPETGREYAVLGRFGGTSFIDITDPRNPVYLGQLPTRSVTAAAASTSPILSRSQLLCHDDCDMPHPDHGEAGSSWRDIKVYQDHAFIVSEEAGHGMQVFDLRRLRDVSEPPEDFTEDAHYDGFGNAHNLELNMATGMAYAVGTRTFNGGPHFVDVSDPQNPVAAGGFGGDGYTHDAQCVIYAGPDEAWQGSEICFNSNENSLTIVDVSDHEVPNQISRTGYPRIAYTHQGWLSEDHRWFYMNDELDARNDNTRTRTLVWDVADLNAPQLVDQYYSPAISIAHNNYVRGDYLYMSNYTSGLRILDISTPDRPIEYAYLDSHPGRHEHVFEGSWSNYPWFESGTVVFTDISGGLFIVRPQLPDSDAGAADLQLTAETESPLQVLSNPWQRGGHVRLQVENHGPQVAVGTELLASLPVAGEIGLPDSVQEECDLEERVLRCRLGDLAVGESVVMDIAVREGNAVDDGLMMSVSSDVADPDTGNNRVTLTLPSASGFLSGSGGSGCSLGQWDPMLVLLMALSLLGLGRRRIRPVGSRSARA